MIKLFAKGQKRKVEASANYIDNNKIVVLKNSKISSQQSEFKMAKDAKEFRSNPKIVDNNYVVLQDVTFKSCSAAAQFVSGYSVNGLNYWKDSYGNSLKEILKKK